MKVIDPFTFLLGVMVAYRLALMFSAEAGPGRIFRKLRNAAPPKSATREGLSCLHCESVWWAAPITAFFWWRGHVALGHPDLLAGNVGRGHCDSSRLHEQLYERVRFFLS